MSRDLKQIKKLSVKRLLKGEDLSAVRASLDKAHFCLYEWVKRIDTINHSKANCWSIHPAASLLLSTGKALMAITRKYKTSFSK